MLSTVNVTAAPAVEPVSLDLARRHCRIDSQAEDDLLAGYLTSARVMAEMYLSRALITQTLVWTMRPEWPVRPSVHTLHGPLELPRAPVQSVSTVVVTDKDGNVTTIPAATLPITPPLLGYKVDIGQTPAQLVIGQGTALSGNKLVLHTYFDTIKITFVAGYGDTGATVPQPIRDATLMITGFLYENRGDVPAELPRAAEWLLDPYRLRFI